MKGSFFFLVSIFGNFYKFHPFLKQKNIFQQYHYTEIRIITWWKKIPHFKEIRIIVSIAAVEIQHKVHEMASVPTSTYSVKNNHTISLLTGHNPSFFINCQNVTMAYHWHPKKLWFPFVCLSAQWKLIRFTFGRDLGGWGWLSPHPSLPMDMHLVIHSI